MASLTRRHACKPYAQQDSAGQLETHDGAADEENNQDDEHESRNRLLGSHFSQNKRVYLAAFRWWTDEYKCAVICALSIILLAILLWYYDGKIAPHISPGLELDMVVIALVTITRVAMGNIVEACISQCAWIWISKSHQLRTKTHARLEDFKLFDEASRGLLGSIALIWRMKGLHLSCIGALIVILTHGFETFSQNMFITIQKPTAYVNATARPAPVPYRSEYWDNVVRRGVSTNYSLSLSTKSALYSGILSVDILALEPPCYTGNCTWPVFPTLAACGECVEKNVSVSCTGREEESCEYSVSANTVVTLPKGNNVDAFKVHPLGTTRKDSTNRTYLAEFELIAASKRHSKVNTTAAECSLWACMMALDIYVMDGRVHQQTVSIWNNTRLENATNAHSTEYVFANIPSLLNIQGNTRYSLSYRSVEALQSFTDFLTEGSYERAFEIVNFSSDWTEAMWNSISDLEAWMDRLTLSLTNEFRRHGALRDAHNTAYEGDATRMASFVHVQWYWLIYMPLFLLLSLYYLFATIMAGVRDDVAIWKGDSMPMLFSCIHPDILTLGTGKMDTHKGLDDLGRHGIALGRDDTGIWTFEPTITPTRAKRRFRRALRME